jgi:asparagine synthase (glutamine-hydrolysing)
MWSPRERVVVSTPRGRLAVIGHCPVTADRLAALAARITSIADVGSVARQLPGSSHLVAAVDGVVWAQGTAAGLRRVFHTEVGGVPVASDRSDLLAALVGAGVDEELFAARMVCELLPPPLGEWSLWRGVRTVPPDHAVVLGRGPARERRWWAAPEPEIPLAAGAAKLREALGTATAARGPLGGRLSADLSSGMDSTSLCFLAVHGGTRLLALRLAEAEACNDDAFYAAAAARELGQAEHLVLAQHELPAIFAEPDALADPEQPYPFSPTAARVRHTARVLAEHGSLRHLGGHGGDELFCKFPGYLHQLLRRRPGMALRHLRGYRALLRWPLPDTAAALARRHDVPSWWRAQADHLTSPPPSPRLPILGWGMRPLRAAPWATAEAVDAARSALRRTAAVSGPFAADRGQHQFLDALRTTAPAYRQLARLYAENGVRLEMPYPDDQVVEAALSVRLYERNNPWRYKTLLSEATRGIVPDVIRHRATKGEFGEDVRVGLRRNCLAILEMFADSALAQRGLIDPDTLRARLLASQRNHDTVVALEFLLGCETWLRAVGRATLPVRSHAPAC